MKKIQYRGLFILLTCCLSSCSDNFLNTTPTDKYTQESFWQTEGNVIAAVNACYAVLRNSNLYGSASILMDTYTPISYSSSGGSNALATGTHNAGNVDLFQGRWNSNYQGIGRANNVLANVDKVSPISESVKQRIKGEASFLRAVFYSDLLNYYGGVPLILDPPDFADQKNLPRDTREQVAAQVLADLENAIQWLPESYSGADVGRATKGAALGLKARFLLYEGKWSEAAAAAKAVIDLEQYSLFPDYRGLFMLENEGNDEVIFDVQFLEPQYTHVYDIQLELQMNSAPTLELVNSYLMKDGMPLEESPLYDPEHPYENRDPRLMQTVVIPGYMFRGAVVPESKYFSTGYGFKKYTTYKDDVSEPNYQRSQINFLFLRYADILLMYAEAQNEAVGPDPSVYDALNQVRSRAGMPAVPEGLLKEEMREVIRHERKIELAGEGLYYNDIRRWRTAETVMNAEVHNSKGEVVQTRTFNPERDYFWPVHIVTLQENPALEQNPGY